MADILLEPGESFEHFHVDESTSELVSGSVELVLPSETRIMKQGREERIPAKTRHVLKNTGEKVARVRCLHWPAE